MSTNPERPVGKLRAVAGRESAYAICNAALFALRKLLLVVEYRDVEGVVIRAMIRSGIAEVCS